MYDPGLIVDRIFSSDENGINMFKKQIANLSPQLMVIVSIFIVLLSISIGAYQPITIQAQSQACPPDPLARFGINVHLEAGKHLTSYEYEQLNLGWYLDYSYRERSKDINGVNYAHVIRTSFDTARLEKTIGPIVDANPGALWLAGNEPDRLGQDGEADFTAADYAIFYHEVYTFLKNRDPSAQVAIAGVVQPTALRLKYLDTILAAYQSEYGTLLPVDVFNTHNFVMNERVIAQAPSDILWGASIPPGFSVSDPLIRYLHPQKAWDIELFKQQLHDLRQWMADNGYRNKPLVVSEYGVLLPEGWDLDGVGTVNFMTQSFDFMLSETNSTTGYPADGNRLVQRFSWFSLNFHDYDPSTGKGLPGAMFDYDTGAMTAVGQAFRNYTENIITACNVPATATPIPTPIPPTPTPEESPIEEPTTDPSMPTPEESPPLELTTNPDAPTPEESPTVDPTQDVGGGGVGTSTPTSTSTMLPDQLTPRDNPPSTSTPNSTMVNATTTMTPSPTVATENTTSPGDTAIPSTSTPVPTATPLAGPTPTEGGLTGQLYIDMNENGRYDATDMPLVGAVVTLVSRSANGILTYRNAITTDAGLYRFFDVTPGDYKLVFRGPSYKSLRGQTEIDVSISTTNLAAQSVGFVQMKDSYIPFISNR